MVSAEMVVERQIQLMIGIGGVHVVHRKAPGLRRCMIGSGIW